MKKQFFDRLFDDLDCVAAYRLGIFEDVRRLGSQDALELVHTDARPALFRDYAELGARAHAAQQAPRLYPGVPNLEGCTAFDKQGKRNPYRRAWTRQFVLNFWLPVDSAAQSSFLALADQRTTRMDLTCHECDQSKSFSEFPLFHVSQEGTENTDPTMRW
jgi:hypothetical protein